MILHLAKINTLSQKCLPSLSNYRVSDYLRRKNVFQGFLNWKLTSINERYAKNKRMVRTAALRCGKRASDEISRWLTRTLIQAHPNFSQPVSPNAFHNVSTSLRSARLVPTKLRLWRQMREKSKAQRTLTKNDQGQEVEHASDPSEKVKCDNSLKKKKTVKMQNRIKNIKTRPAEGVTAWTFQKNDRWENQANEHSRFIFGWA